MKTRTLRLSALFTAAALTATGCTSVADMMGYDTATLNASAAKSHAGTVTVNTSAVPASTCILLSVVGECQQFDPSRNGETV